MPVCMVKCSECGKHMHGSEPSKIDYRMVVIGGRIRPLCEPCYDDRRTT